MAQMRFFEQPNQRHYVEDLADTDSHAMFSITEILKRSVSSVHVASTHFSYNQQRISDVAITILHFTKSREKRKT